uniref:Lipoprotein n=1 Tax=Arundo donax TaxID=35708 RepID=A0A0A8XSP8_ARUDO
MHRRDRSAHAHAACLVIARAIGVACCCRIGSAPEKKALGSHRMPRGGPCPA